MLVHGYSGQAEAFSAWEKTLAGRGYDVTTIHACSYRSLTNEVTIKDIAEGFDRALRERTGLSADEPFDAIVHSTGMLVTRAWLTVYQGRRDRLKHLIGLAPATFGSPLAHKGRSWLGALFKGNKDFGPDFLEAGDEILDGLELGSAFTWDLAHADLLGEETYYGPTKRTPFVFIFCGTRGYGGVKKLVTDAPGTDGTVRWSSCALNTRKICIDMTRDSARDDTKRVTVAPWKNADIPLIPVEGRNHGTILSEPTAELTDMIDSALQVSSAAEFAAWTETSLARTKEHRAKLEEWQQFVIRAVDERGDPVRDWNIQLFTFTARGSGRQIRPFDVDVHVYKRDPSLRCFHVNLGELDYRNLLSLWVRVIASSGSQLVGYHGFSSADGDGDALEGGKWTAALDISSLIGGDVKFFYPFTTTLVELRLNREPLPLTGRNQVCWF